MVSNLLFPRKHARPDIQPTIAFLTTKVRNPNKDDWKKLQRVLSYLDATINRVKIQLNTNNLNVFYCWVDTSYGTYPYLK